MAYLISTGAVESPADARDFWAHDKMAEPAKSGPLPLALDFRPWMPPVTNQGGEGSCVGHAFVGADGYKQRVEPAPGKAAPDHETLSARFAYWGARQLVSYPTDGAQIIAALKWAQRRGVELEFDAPYFDGNRNFAPRPGWETRAQRNRIASYGRVVHQNLEAMARAMGDYGPLMVEVMTDDGFNSPQNGLIKPGGAQGGRHAIVAAGYDLKRGTLLVRNSWGFDWGINGYAEMPIGPHLLAAWYLAPNRDPNAAWIPWHERMAPDRFLEA